jgi:hypothetical protein
MTVREALTQQNPGALFYPDRFETALVGMTFGFRATGETRAVAVYDHSKLVEILAAEFAKDDARDGEEREDEERYDDADEWIDYNMAGAYLGPDMPVIVISGDSL